MLDPVWDVLNTLLGIGEDTLNAGQMAVRAALTFAVTIALIRIGDKRMFGKGTAFDVVVAIMLGSIMSRAITGSSGFFATWLAGLVLVAMHWLLALLSYRLDWFGPLVKGNPILLIKDGEIQRDGMRAGSVTSNDLDQAMRAEGSRPDPIQIEAAVLERDGSISVIERRGEPQVLDISIADGVQTVRISLG